jgi:hypothetical protein
MPAAPSVGTLTKFAAGAANPPSAAYEYKDTFTLGKHGTVLSTDGIRGTRSHPVERTRTGTYTVSGQIVMEPGPVDLDFWLQQIMGGSPSGSGTVTYPVAETVPAFYVGIDRIAAMYLYSGCKVDKATFRGHSGSLVEMTLNIEALTETAGSISGLSALVPSLGSPYVFMDATLTIGGTSYQFMDFELTIDNRLKKDRFVNSVSRTDLPELDRMVSLNLGLPFTSDTLTKYDLNATSAAVVLTFTNGSFVLTATMPAVQWPTEPINTPGREDVLLPLRGGMARKSSTTAEISFTNKSA